MPVHHCFLCLCRMVVALQLPCLPRLAAHRRRSCCWKMMTTLTLTVSGVQDGVRGWKLVSLACKC
jgi:hypothetical protein